MMLPSEIHIHYIPARGARRYKLTRARRKLRQLRPSMRRVFFSVQMEVRLVGGGGSGGNGGETSFGGGGQSVVAKPGEFVTKTFAVFPDTTYTITVGQGQPDRHNSSSPVEVHGSLVSRHVFVVRGARKHELEAVIGRLPCGPA